MVQTSYVLKTASLPFLSLKSAAYKQERLQIESGLWWRAYGNCFWFFSGLSLVQVKSPDAIGVSKSTTLNCWYYLNNPGELIYSVSWYWTPPIRKSSDLDFRCWDKSRLMSRPEFPTKTVHFFRYRKIDPDGERKKAWNHQLRGIFDVNVGFFWTFNLHMFRFS